MARVSLAEGYPARSALSRSACGLRLSMRRMESNEPDDLSEQTRWMIAVRDTDDRAAFARLFDFYAPRVKALAMRGGTPAGGGRGHRAGRHAAGVAVARAVRSVAGARSPAGSTRSRATAGSTSHGGRRGPCPRTSPPRRARRKRPPRWPSSRRRRGCAGRFGRCRRDSARWSSRPTSASSRIRRSAGDQPAARHGEVAPAPRDRARCGMSFRDLRK